MLTENNLIDLLENYFKTRKFKTVQKLSSKQRGIDLIVRDLSGSTYYIEAKGQTSGRENSSRFGKDFDKKQIRNHISMALLKTLENKEKHLKPTDKFGMAFPLNHYNQVLSIKPSLKKLGIIVYFITGDGIQTL